MFKVYVSSFSNRLKYMLLVFLQSSYRNLEPPPPPTPPPQKKKNKDQMKSTDEIRICFCFSPQKHKVLNDKSKSERDH